MKALLTFREYTPAPSGFSSRLRDLSLGIILLTVFAGMALAQTGASTLVGRLVDPANAVITGASITVVSQATKATSTATSNDTGLFRVLDLPPGEYSIRVEASGFKVQEIQKIDLASSETRDLGTVVMQLGAVTEEVSVTAAATPVQTASSERSALIDSKQLSEIALKGRDSFGYMRLLPGVIDANTSRDLAGPGSSSNIYINGMNSNTKNVSFDGITELDQGGANAVYVSPNQDAIGEIRVLSNSYQAEYGRTAGGGINMVTKSGTSDFHGALFWNRRHEDMNANTFFNNRQGIQRPIYRYFVGGYAIGGPAYIPKLLNTNKKRFFFFVSQEFTRVAQPTVTSQALLPTALERSGDFSKSVNSVGTVIKIIDPQTGAQFPGNKIPSSRIDSTGQAILNLFMMPNGYVNPAQGQQYTSNFIASATPYRNRRDSIVRIDSVSMKNTNVFFRWGQDTSNTEQEFTVSPGVGSLNQFLPGYNVAVHAATVISSTMVNEVLVGIGHNNFGFFYPNGTQPSWLRGSALNPPTLRPFPTGPQYVNYLPSFTFAGGPLLSSTTGPTTGAFYSSYTGNLSSNNTFPIPYKNFNDTYTFQDDLSLVRGKHTFKTGVYFEWNSKIEPARGYNYAGVFNFGSNVNNPLDSGDGFANALLGNFQTYTEATNRLVPNPHFSELEGYLQDSWRFSPRLTLDLGVRWYHMGVPGDTVNAYSGFYPQLWNPSQAPRIYRPAVVAGKNVAIDPQTGAIVSSALQNTIVPGSGSPVDGMHLNGLTGKGDFFTFPTLAFSPRIGFAYDVFGDGKMAIRGSFGTYYNRPNANFISGELGAPPVVYTPVVYYSSISQIPQAAASAAITPTIAATSEPHQKLERNHQLNLTIQRDIGHGTVLDVAYVGNFDRHAQTQIELNPLPYGIYANPANLFTNAAGAVSELNTNLLRTKYPGMGTITYYTDSLSTLNYHGLQVQAQHRLSKGLQFGASYSFSKALGSCGFAPNASGCNAWDPWHATRQWYYGPLQQDRTQVLQINYAYTLPTPGLKWKPAKAVFGDWILSGVTAFSTGAPVTPDCSSISAGPANSDPSLSGAGALGNPLSATNYNGARCQEIGNPNNFTHSFYQNFNTSAFTLAAPGTFGNIGLGILRQPSYTNFDMNLEKRIHVGSNEKRQIRLRIEAYNVFNHTEFSTFGTTLSLQGTTNVNTQYGQYTQVLPPRQMSTTLRFEF